MGIIIRAGGEASLLKKMIDRAILQFLLVTKIQVRRYHSAQGIEKMRLKKQILKFFLILKMLLKKRRDRSVWVRHIFTEEQRFLKGAGENLIRELEIYDKQKYINYLRVPPELFQELLAVIGPKIEKMTVVREPITASTRLQILLRYLASGDSMTSLSYEFRVGVSTVSEIVNETCDAVWDTLSPVVFIEPSPEEWEKVSRGFENEWNIPHCVGAIDGRHMVVQAPPHSGSIYYNYKGTHSIVFLAISDARGRFLMCDIGAPGRRSDGGIFRESIIGQRFFSKLMNLPVPDKLGNDGPNIPYFIIGDEGFPLESFLMRPFPRRGKLSIRQKVFNYRLCRARRIVECSFGILVQRFRIFRKPIIADINTVVKIVKAAICLHNLILERDPIHNKKNKHIQEMIENSVSESFFPNEIEGEEEQLLNPLNIRKHLAEFFMDEGSVSWQWEKVRNCDY